MVLIPLLVVAALSFRMFLNEPTRTPLSEEIRNTTAPFFSASPYVLTEGCLEVFSKSKSLFSYDPPRLSGDMHDRPTNLTPGLFNVPQHKTFMNTVVVVIDSLSRAQIMAYMPRLRRLMMEFNMSGGYDKIFVPFANALALDGTTPFFFSSLLSGREFQSSNKHRTWLQDELIERGYVFRYFGRTWPIAIEFYRKFPNESASMMPNWVTEKNQFSEDYVVPFESIKKLVACNSNKFCRHGGDVHEELSLQVEGLRQLWIEYKFKPKFAIVHMIGSHSPNLPESIAAYDTELTSLLQDLIKSRNMNVILATDHGRVDDENSFGFPLLAAILSKNALNEERTKNLIHNSNRMVTVYDIHHTLRHLLLGDVDAEAREATKQEFARSMMASKIAENRTCSSAGVAPGVCPCLTRLLEIVTPERELIIRPLLEKLLKDRQQPGCSVFEFKEMVVRAPKDVQSTRRRLVVTMEAFISAEIHVQNNVTFRLRGFLMGGTILLNSLKQTTPYRKFEHCTPEGSNAEFCICDDNITSNAPPTNQPPTNPSPTNPPPTNPLPTNPVLTNLPPTNPNPPPTNPAPTNPTPTNPVPTNPTPTNLLKNPPPTIPLE